MVKLLFRRSRTSGRTATPTTNQESNAHATYYRTMYDSSQKMTTDITAEEFNNKCNLLHTSRSELSSTDRRITPRREISTFGLCGLFL